MTQIFLYSQNINPWLILSFNNSYCILRLIEMVDTTCHLNTEGRKTVLMKICTCIVFILMPCVFHVDAPIKRNLYSLARVVCFIKMQSLLVFYTPVFRTQFCCVKCFKTFKICSTGISNKNMFSMK